MKFVCKAYRYTGRVRGQVDWFNGPREHLAGCRAWREKRPAAVNGAGRGVESHGRAHRRERKTYRHDRSAERCVLAIIQARRRVTDGSEIPSKSAVHRSPALVGWPAVSVPELIISPADKG